MEEYGSVLTRLQAQCSRRECCSSDILRKASAAFDGDLQQAAKLLESLVEDGFVDDRRYAAAFAREKSRLGGWGPARITTALVLKGIPREVAREALGEIDPEEAHRKMVSVLEARYKMLKEEPYAKFKLLRYGLGRGYDYDTLAPEVERILAAVDDEGNVCE